MKKLTFSLIILAFASILNSCGIQKTVAIKPDLGVTKKNTIPLSTINLPISVNCLSLENNMANEISNLYSFQWLSLILGFVFGIWIFSFICCTLFRPSMHEISCLNSSEKKGEYLH